MANIIRYVLRGDTGENWQRVNPVLLYNEVAYDRTANRLKFGDGATPWKELPYVAPDVVNDLTTGGTDKALSAEQGKKLKALIDDKTNTVDIINDLTSTSATAALSAAQGKELNDKLGRGLNFLHPIFLSFVDCRISITGSHPNGKVTLTALTPSQITQNNARYWDGIIFLYAAYQNLSYYQIPNGGWEAEQYAGASLILGEILKMPDLIYEENQITFLNNYKLDEHPAWTHTMKTLDSSSIYIYPRTPAAAQVLLWPTKFIDITD